MQRGLIVHNTHLAQVEHNVFHAVRGPALYVQDGLETYNRFMYNVALCHRTRSDDGFVTPSTCGGVLSLPAYEWQNGCACAGC